VATCKHCNRRKAVRPRGLCCPCYDDPEVRALHPSTSRYARRGVGHDGGGVPLTATDAAPGTEAKVQVLEERARLGVDLWHPDDRPFGPAPAACPATWRPAVSTRLPVFAGVLSPAAVAKWLNGNLGRSA
jgi:hypothetical protein